MTRPFSASDAQSGSLKRTLVSKLLEAVCDALPFLRMTLLLDSFSWLVRVRYGKSAFEATKHPNLRPSLVLNYVSVNPKFSAKQYISRTTGQAAGNRSDINQEYTYPYSSMRHSHSMLHQAQATIQP